MNQRRRGIDSAPIGTNGPAFWSGHGDPLPALGSTGDTYLDLDTANVWVKIDGEWSLEANFSTGVSLASDAVPQPPGSVGAPGTGSLLARDDHIHPYGTLPVLGALAAAINGFRLAPTADDSSPADGTFSIVYLAPVRGTQIGLYDTAASTWRLFTPASLSYTLTSRTAGRPFDVFAYQTAGTVFLEIVDWASPTARVTGITQINGVWTKSGDITRRYLGTVRARSATTYQVWKDATYTTSSAGIDIWNVDNRRQFGLMMRGPNTDWTYNTTTYRQAGGSANAQIDTISGLPGVDAIPLWLLSLVSSTGTGAGDKAAVAVSQSQGPTHTGLRGLATVNTTVGAVLLMAGYVDTVPLGVGAYKWLERGTGSGVTTWQGNTVTETHPGMQAIVWC